MEEIYQRKNQVIWRIKQGSDGNWTEIGRPKVTDIDYNTVVPFYCCSGGKKMDFNSLKFQFQSKNGSAFLEHQHRPKEFFSYCGIALSAKRGSVRGDALMNQILLKIIFQM